MDLGGHSLMHIPAVSDNSLAGFLGLAFAASHVSALTSRIDLVPIARPPCFWV